MTLGKLIKWLEEQPQDAVIRHGFNNPHSFRGYYDELAFEPAENVTISSMLADARYALGRTFEGYKGGDYEMDEYTDCWISQWGTSYGATRMGFALLHYWQDDIDNQKR